MEVLQSEVLLRNVLMLAKEAGRRIMDVYETGTWEVNTKADSTLLTTADLVAHRYLNTELKQLTPGIPVLSEEDAGVTYEERRHWPQHWLVDPLDGTKEFVERTNEFTVNIALIEAGIPILGVVYAPALNVLYAGQRGFGAFKEDSQHQKHRLRVRACPAKPVVLVSRHFHEKQREKEIQAWLGTHYDMKVMGSALKPCCIAEGVADFYPRLGPTSEWDTAAAQCLLEEAGGSMIDLTGQPLRYNSKDSLVNPHFWAVGDATKRLREGETA